MITGTVTNTEISQRYTKLHKSRKNTNLLAKGILLAGTAAGMKAVSKDNKAQRALAKGVDIFTGSLAKGLKTIDKKSKFKKAAGFLDKVKHASPKTKAMAVIGAFAAHIFLNTVRSNSCLKGILMQSEHDEQQLNNCFVNYIATELPYMAQRW